MKPVVSLLAFALLAACAPQNGTPPDASSGAAPTAATSTPTGTAVMPDTPSPKDAKRAAGVVPPTSANAATDAASLPPPSANATASDAPPKVRGIAVGEPHPSGRVPIDAGPARYDGYGDLRFGMSVAEARKAWKGELQGDDVKSGACGYLRATGTAAGPYLMFEHGAFVRYDVRGANATAPGGGRVGMAADDIRHLYAGRVQDAPHKYVQGGHDLRVTDPASKDRALLFEVDQYGRVTTWRVGRTPQVDYVEGCS